MVDPSLPSGEDEKTEVRVKFHIIENNLVDDSEYGFQMGLASEHSKFPPPTTGFRWIHVPTNNISAVEAFFKKCHPDYYMHPSIGTMKLRPILSRAVSTPAHAKHLEASCTEGVIPTKSMLDEGSWLPPISVYLPYMSWMKFKDFCSLREHYRKFERVSPTSHSKTSMRMKTYPSNPPSKPAGEPNHPRRTLDQFYYPALSDTSARDADQTISKWSGTSLPEDGGPQATNESVLIMVDQLWCWIVDENTIITSFPSPTDVDHNLPDCSNLYDSIRAHVKGCKTVWDLHSLIVNEAIGYMFSHRNRTFRDIIETYRWVTSKKAAYQTTDFQDFHRGYVNGGFDAAIFYDRRDLKLVLELADIIDELKMIRHLLQTQREVLQLTNSALHKFDRRGTATDRLDGAFRMLSHKLTEIADISTDADDTRKMLLDLLDLKSKAASLTEARATTKQGQAVMLFTVVTIIFLPLSFFTSYFGQNVSEFTGDDKNSSTWKLWRTATPISIVVIVVALLIAYYITTPNSPL